MLPQAKKIKTNKKEKKKKKKEPTLDSVAFSSSSSSLKLNIPAISPETFKNV
jgi:hypothetical protein